MIWYQLLAVPGLFDAALADNVVNLLTRTSP